MATQFGSPPNHMGHRLIVLDLKLRDDRTQRRTRLYRDVRHSPSPPQIGNLSFNPTGVGSEPCLQRLDIPLNPVIKLGEFGIHFTLPAGIKCPFLLA